MTRILTDNEFVVSFQERAGLVADGVAGPATLAVLDRVLPVTRKRVSQAGINLIHSFESLRLDAYPDPGSSNGLPVTIGWGSTQDENGRPIKIGDRWTKERADARFADDLSDDEQVVSRLAPVTTQGQFDALVSFQYNTGALAKSTLLKRHNAGDYAGAADQFARWVFNDGKRLRGLERRRDAERALYEGKS